MADPITRTVPMKGLAGLRNRLRPERLAAIDKRR